MERIFLLTLLFFLSQEAEANPISNKYFKLISEEEAHYITGAAQHRFLDSQSIKAFVWNIKKTEMSHWKNEFIRYGEDQDLFLLQEAYQNPIYHTATLHFSHIRWDLGASFLYRQDGRATGTAIGSIAVPTEITIKHSVDREPIVGTPKSMTFAKYLLTDHDKELLVISVHGINITSFDSFKRHMEQARHEIKKHQGPILFAGDFNTRTKKRTEYLLELVKKLNLKTVNFKNAEHRMVWKFTKNYLDHSFTRGLKIKKAEVLKDSRGSDHRPMALEFSVTE